jgi:hypothetical protein
MFPISLSNEGIKFHNWLNINFTNSGLRTSYFLPDKKGIHVTGKILANHTKTLLHFLQSIIDQ